MLAAACEVDWLEKMVTIRDERAEVADRISALTSAAFAGAAHSSGTEAKIVEGLRRAGALTASMVAADPEIVGHVAFSPVTIDGATGRWYGLGPVSVLPGRQGQGVGGRLIREGLDRLARAGAEGCVVLGDPLYYARFGFESDPGLKYGDVPPEYFQRLLLGGPPRSGEVAFHAAFDA